jgi:hypothetical protein
MISDKGLYTHTHIHTDIRTAILKKKQQTKICLKNMEAETNKEGTAHFNRVSRANRANTVNMNAPPLPVGRFMRTQHRAEQDITDGFTHLNVQNSYLITKCR